MPRLVRHALTGPIKIEPQAKPIWVCGCGLSQTFPICDGAHKGACSQEQAGTLYIYDAERKRVIDTRPDDAAPAPSPPAAPS